MSITSVDKDLEGLTLILTAEFDASPERVWGLWADPRKLERWWGPPTHPATVAKHDLSPGGEVSYFMTGPEGDRFHGWWRVEAANPPHSLEFTDGFSYAEGEPAEDMPESKVYLDLSESDGGTRMTIRCVFESREQMNELMEMGAAEGLQQAVGQMDALLAE